MILIWRDGNLVSITLGKNVLIWKPALFMFFTCYFSMFAQHENGDILMKKGDFLLSSDHVIEIVAKLYLLIQNATCRSPDVLIANQWVQTPLASFIFFAWVVCVKIMPFITLFWEWPFCYLHRIGKRAVGLWLEDFLVCRSDSIWIHDYLFVRWFISVPFANCWQFHCYLWNVENFTGKWCATQTVWAFPIVVTLAFFHLCSMNAEMNGTLVEVTFKTGLPEIPPGVIKVNRKSNKLEILQCWHRISIKLLYIFWDFTIFNNNMVKKKHGFNTTSS